MKDRRRAVGTGRHATATIRVEQIRADQAGVASLLLRMDVPSGIIEENRAVVLERPLFHQIGGRDNE
jgi:hypothetical protein